MPERHALLGPSGAHRWLACPPSARLCEGMEDRGTVSTREGTLAHRMGELLLRERWEGENITAELEKVQLDPLYTAEMGEHIDAYVAYIEERMAEAHTRCGDPRIYIEQEIHYEDYVPDGFGTTDVLIVSDELLDVVDLKYGRGVRVEADNNPQLLIYALGGYLAWGWAFGIERVRATIFQPRLDHIASMTIPVKDLLAWAEDELKPRAELAWNGEGAFGPGEATCRWCKAAPRCRAWNQYNLELAKLDFREGPLLSPEEVAEVLDKIPGLLAWAEGVKSYALRAALEDGEAFPGYKLVTGRSNRKYRDEGAIAAALRKAGYRVADIYKPRELLGLTAMEKLVGPQKLQELAGSYIMKPEGAPVLVPNTDPRPELNTAAAAAEDFKEEI